MVTDFRLLGPVEMWHADRRIDTDPRVRLEPVQRLVLAALLIEAGQIVTWDSLIDRVYGPRPPDTARSSLRGHIARVGKALDMYGQSAMLENRRGVGYVIAVDQELVDWHHMERLGQRARDQQGTERARLLRRALGLWRGDPLADLQGDWVDAMRTHKRLRRHDMVLEWASAEIDAGYPDTALADLTDLLHEDALSERCAQLLMISLHQCGRQAEALRVYDQLRVRLRDELGADPGPPLQDMHTAILRGENTRAGRPSVPSATTQQQIVLLTRQDVDPKCDSDGLQHLMLASRCQEVMDRADLAAERAESAVEYARVHLMKFGAALNLRLFADAATITGESAMALRDCQDPTLDGQFHALAGYAAYQQGSIERCLTHLVRGGQALERVRRPDERAAFAWEDLAETLSVIGLHQPAMRATRRGQQIARAIGADHPAHDKVETRIRAAIALDQKGDTTRCIERLLDIVDTFPATANCPGSSAYLGYALARLAALGISINQDPRPLLDADVPAYGEFTDLRLLVRACLAIADDDPRTALRSLESYDGTLCGVGIAEISRLRAITHLATGDHQAAYRAGRETTEQLMREADRLQGLLLGGTSLLANDGLALHGETGTAWRMLGSAAATPPGEPRLADGAGYAWDLQPLTQHG